MSTENKYGMERIIVMLLAWFFGAFGLHLVYMGRPKEFRRHWQCFVTSLFFTVLGGIAWGVYCEGERMKFSYLKPLLSLENFWSLETFALLFLALHLTYGYIFFELCLLAPIGYIWRAATYSDHEFSELIGRNPSLQIPERGYSWRGCIGFFVVFIVLVLITVPANLQRGHEDTQDKIVEQVVQLISPVHEAMREIEANTINRHDYWNCVNFKNMDLAEAQREIHKYNHGLKKSEEAIEIIWEFKSKLREDGEIGELFLKLDNDRRKKVEEQIERSARDARNRIDWTQGYLKGIRSKFERSLPENID